MMMIKKKLHAVLLAACSLLVFTIYAGESISGGRWSATADKGELTGASVDGTPFLASLGGFHVIGKKEVRPFKDVSELRENEKKKEMLIYEGISDDGKNLFVEFGAVIKTGKSLDFLLFMSWLPPGPQIPDAVEGTLKFAAAVKNIKKISIPKSDTVIPGTCDFLLSMKNRTKVRMRVQGLDQKKIEIKKDKQGVFVMRFEERRDYLCRDYTLKKKDISSNSRLLEYWIRNIDTHFIQFTFSKMSKK
jgi:hypothetical protein